MTSVRFKLLAIAIAVRTCTSIRLVKQLQEVMSTKGRHYMM